MPPRPRIQFMAARARAMARDPVTLHWAVVTGGTVDPVYGTRTGGTSTPHSLPVKASLHWPDFSRGQLVQNTEVQQGDVIADFPASVVLTGLAELEFEIEGRRYRQKSINPSLLRAWDVVIEGTRLHQTVLLTPAK